MKDFSLFLLKNSLASKMKKGFRNFCSGVGSTSTVNQKSGGDVSCVAAPSLVCSYLEESTMAASPLTLEQMMLQLDIEEEAARRAKLDDYGDRYRRMSCVNNSDILRSARNALNQYPRFSLDGKDAMYRSSFHNYGSQLSGLECGRRSVCCSNGPTERFCKNDYRTDIGRNPRLPSKLAGEAVVWCKPGVVAKLMGLDAVPVPVPVGGRRGKRAVNLSASRKQNLRMMARHELEKERLYMGSHGCNGRSSGIESIGSCSRPGNCMMSPVDHKPTMGTEDWRFRRAR